MKNIILENIVRWGFTPIDIDDYGEVFNTFVKEEPHLVLLDINLPSYDGFYWCNKIRTVSKVPIVFISSRNSNMDIVMAMNMGGDDFVQKPFSMEVLMAKINALLRRTYDYTNVESSVVEHRTVVLNLKDNNLIYNDKKVELTKNEFKILYILMKNNGTIVSREKIMRKLWEDESFVDDNTLTVNINRLRKKLSDIDLENFIETKKGQGYVIL
ncbi:MAG TPA: DNA-binding response regulator [Clostridium sp.]|nr:DNA-binding response regulator [Clostridium sp.]